MSYCLIFIYNIYSFTFDTTWTTLATGKHMTLVTLVRNTVCFSHLSRLSGLLPELACRRLCHDAVSLVWNMNRQVVLYHRPSFMAIRTVILLSWVHKSYRGTASSLAPSTQCFRGLLTCGGLPFDFHGSHDWILLWFTSSVANTLHLHYAKEAREAGKLLTFCLIFCQESEVDIVVQNFTKVAKRTGHTSGFWPHTSVLARVGSLTVVGFASMVQRWSIAMADSIWSRVIIFKFLKTVTMLFHLSVMTFPNKKEKKHGIMFGIRKNRSITLVQQHLEIYNHSLKSYWDADAVTQAVKDMKYM